MSGYGIATHNSSLRPVLGPSVSVPSSHLLFGSIKMLLIPRTSFAWYPAFSLGVCILVSHSSLGWREGAGERTLRVVFRVGSGKEGEARARWVEVGVQEQGRESEVQVLGGYRVKRVWRWEWELRRQFQQHGGLRNQFARCSEAVEDK